MGGTCSTLEGDEKVIQNFGPTTRRERSLGRSRPRWGDNIKMDLKEIGWEGVDWIHLAQSEPLVGPCEHSNELSAFAKNGEFHD
jgi:hypothetical protein